MNDQRRYVRRSEFAALQGWSKAYVTELGHKGRLVLGPDSKLVDVDATRALLQHSSDPARTSTRRRHSLGRLGRDLGAGVLPASSSAAAPGAGDSDPNYWCTKTRREGALAELAELELAQRRGVLVDRARVESMAYASGRMLRDTVLGLPTQLAPQIAAMTDVSEIEAKLRTAFRQVFADAEGIIADDLQRSVAIPV
jgi:hypothetical protein